MHPLRLFRTIRHLKPVQLRNRLKRKLFKVKADLSPSPVRRVPSGRFVSQAHRTSTMFSETDFRFLNVEGRCVLPEDWNRPEAEKLWLYNLHYLDDLNAFDAPNRLEWHRKLVTRWVEENPPGTGNGWEPYPLSLRIVNLIKWHHSSGELDEGQIQSLAVQVRFLEKSLEYHLLGNHLFANGKALAIAGMFFGGSEGGRWLNKGMNILREQLDEQILKDGGHFERSVMYHSIILEDLLDLFNLSAVYRDRLPIPHLEEMKSLRLLAGTMVKYLEIMCHPDGRICLFNDAAFGISASPEELMEYANRLQVLHEESFDETPLKDLSESGYFKAIWGEQTLFVDAAAVGPDYLPGHAHADTLGFELSLRKQRILVDSGTSCYGSGEERIRQRSTSAHNCLLVDGSDSSEVWSGFRMGRRAKVVQREAWESDSGIMLEASHNGYKYLRGVGLYKRRWNLEEGMLEIHDTLPGRGVHNVELGFLFHPELTVKTQSGSEFSLEDSKGVLLGKVFTESGLDAETIESSYHPEFGISLPATRLVLRTRGRFPMQLRTRFEWTETARVVN